MRAELPISLFETATGSLVVVVQQVNLLLLVMALLMVELLVEGDLSRSLVMNPRKVKLYIMLSLLNVIKCFKILQKGHSLLLSPFCTYTLGWYIKR